MPYHHLAHLDTFSKPVKKGVKVNRGDVLGTVGKTGTQYAHLHYEVRKSRPDYWTQYVYLKSGQPMTKDQVQNTYANPEKWIDKSAKIPAPYTTYGGWEYLDPINKAGTAFHAGVDVNDRYGDQDLGNTIKSPCTGEIVYCARLDGGWGNHIWIYEDDTNEHPLIDMAFAKSLAGRMFLQVESHGEAWYIDNEGKRHFMGGTAEEILAFIKKTAVGISNADLNKVPIQN